MEIIDFTKFEGDFQVENIAKLPLPTSNFIKSPVLEYLENVTFIKQQRLFHHCNSDVTSILFFLAAAAAASSINNKADFILLHSNTQNLF